MDVRVADCGVSKARKTLGDINLHMGGPDIRGWFGFVHMRRVRLGPLVITRRRTSGQSNPSGFVWMRGKKLEGKKLRGKN